MSFAAQYIALCSNLLKNLGPPYPNPAYAYVINQDPGYFASIILLQICTSVYYFVDFDLHFYYKICFKKYVIFVVC